MAERGRHEAGVSTVGTGLDELVARVRQLARPGRRVLLGICGPPAAGKSTLATALTEELVAAGAEAVCVPMDGFHLADVALDRLGRRDRKGALDTFDGHGYLALLRRLRAEHGHTVWAPAFERELEQPLAGAIAVPAGTAVVVTEGNYLLAQVPPWPEVRAALDEVWFVDLDDAVRLRRLHERHVRFGKSPEQATAWIDSVDEPNAALIRAGRHLADLQVRGR